MVWAWNVLGPQEVSCIQSHLGWFPASNHPRHQWYLNPACQSHREPYIRLAFLLEGCPCTDHAPLQPFRAPAPWPYTPWKAKPLLPRLGLIEPLFSLLWALGTAPFSCTQVSLTQLDPSLRGTTTDLPLQLLHPEWTPYCSAWSVPEGGPFILWPLDASLHFFWCLWGGICTICLLARVGWPCDGTFAWKGDHMKSRHRQLTVHSLPVPLQ